MYKITKQFVLLFIVLIAICFTGYAQKNKQKALKYYLSHIDFLIKDGGKWKTDNKDHDASADSSANYYLIEYTKGTDAYTLNFKLKGYISQKTEWITFQQGSYTWDDTKQMVVFHTSFADQIEINGESKLITSKLMSFNSLTILPDGKPDNLYRSIKFINNQIEEIQSYRIDSSCFGLIIDKAVWNRTSL